MDLADHDPLGQVPELHQLIDVNATKEFDNGLSGKLGYQFQDSGLLKRALTHSSRRGSRKDNERLEFLGDRVLALVIAEALYANHGNMSEGEMAPRLSSLVKGEVCAEVGRSIGLQHHIEVGAQEAVQGIHLATTVLGDAMEAVIAAIYLEAGLEAARGVILALWDAYLSHADAGRKDAKTFLQEWALARALGIPAYRVTGRAGPDHAPRFEAEVQVNGLEAARGNGASKRIAEHNAAEQLINREGLRT